MAKTATALAPEEKVISIKAPNLQVAAFKITGTAPYVQHRFYKKAEIMKTQSEGSTAKTKKRREARDFENDFKEAQYKSLEGWNGIPATSFRNAMVRACSLVDYVMTRAKLAIFIIHDGIDADGVPLVKIAKGQPRRADIPVRNADGSLDIRSLPMWDEIEFVLRVRFDADQFTAGDIANLVQRAGMQVGIGEGRPSAKKNCGMGWGTFTIVEEA